MTADVRGTVSRPDVPDGRTGTLATLVAGTRVGKYEILAVLGQGGFGITYRAHDTQLDRDVAVKEYLPTAFAVREPDSTVLPRSTHVAEDFRWGRERFLAEAKTLAHLEHAAGVVNVHDFLEANGTAYMVMGLVRGETLESRLRRERVLPQAAIERMLPSLLDGLEKVHAADFLHRDIKPANILLDANGQPTLIDFGASRAALQGRTQVLTAVYTPGYAAFEQFTSARQGPWTDIYALGATLYHCVSGRPPLAATDRMIGETLVPALEAGKGRYAPSLLAAIDAALKLRDSERPQTIAAWRHLLSGGHASTSAGSTPAPTRHDDRPAVPGEVTHIKSRGWRWIRSIAATLALLAMAGGAFVAWQRLDGGRGAPVTSQDAQGDEAAWAAARSTGTAGALRAYIEKYPTGRHVAEARTLIADIDRRDQESARARQAADEQARAEEAAWTSARAAGTSAAVRGYLERYPGGRYSAEARALLLDIERRERDELTARQAADEQARAEAAAWSSARAAGTSAAVRGYLERYPGGRYSAEARALLVDIERRERDELAARQAADERARADEAAWAMARGAGTASAFRRYVEQYPAGRYVEEARSALREIERREREAAAVPQSLLQVIARGRWVIGTEADCWRGGDSVYRAEVTGSQIVWTKGSTRRYVEQIEEDAPHFARTISIHSTLPGASNDNVGTRWQYVLVRDGTIRVERAARAPFTILRCPGN